MNSWKQRIAAGAAALAMLGGCAFPGSPVCAADGSGTQRGTLAADAETAPLYTLKTVGVDYAEVSYDLAAITGLDSTEGIGVRAWLFENIPEGTDLVKAARALSAQPDASQEEIRAYLCSEYGEEAGKAFDLYQAGKETVRSYDLTNGKDKDTVSGLEPETSYTVVLTLEKDGVEFLPEKWDQLQFQTDVLPVIGGIAEDIVEYNGFAVTWQVEVGEVLSYVVALYKGVPELDASVKPATSEEVDALMGSYDADYVDLAFPNGSTLRYGKGGLEPDTLYTVAVMPLVRASKVESVPALIQVRTPHAPGDVNLDKTVNASDAAHVLIAAAQIGASKPSSLTDEQEKLADVNGDGSINATDAALLLQYAAYIGAGNPEMSLPDFLARDKNAE